jgi:hypothetical protein
MKRLRYAALKPYRYRFIRQFAENEPDHFMMECRKTAGREPATAPIEMEPLIVFKKPGQYTDEAERVLTTVFRNNCIWTPPNPNIQPAIEKLLLSYFFS